MDKPILFYEVRQHQNRITGSPVYVPAIVEREPAVPLDEIIRRAIDRGLIAGLKTSAAKQVADAIAQQMYEEFVQGRGVKFGNYFYARLYLSGTSNAVGLLTPKNNGINVRFANGAAFKLTYDMFSFSNVAGGDIPGVDFLISDVNGAQRNVLRRGANMLLNGVNLYATDDSTKVEFFAVDPETGATDDTATLTVTEFVSRGPNLLTLAWDSALEAHGQYFVVPSRSADGERWFTGTGKNVSIEAA
jgi:hypothetical protein